MPMETETTLVVGFRAGITALGFDWQAEESLRFPVEARNQFIRNSVAVNGGKTNGFIGFAKGGCKAAFPFRCR